MTVIQFQRDIDFPAPSVWAVLEDFGNMSWAQGLSRVEIMGEGVGMTRRLHMDGMEPIDEVLESMEPEIMAFSYSIPRGLPLPVDDYLARARLEALESERTRVNWTCECTPRDPEMDPAELEKMIHATYNLLVDMVSAHLERNIAISADAG